MRGNPEKAGPVVDVLIEIPRGSCLKRGSRGEIDFVSPIPCPFNYGSVPGFIGGEGDLLDAVVLGPRLPVGTRVSVRAWGAVGLSERYMSDDKLICADFQPGLRCRRNILLFFHFYAFCKGMLNRVRHQQGASRCTGWDSAAAALSRAVPVDASAPVQPRIGF